MKRKANSNKVEPAFKIQAAPEVIEIADNDINEEEIDCTQLCELQPCIGACELLKYAGIIIINNRLLPNVDPEKKWQEWTKDENEEILNAFRGRISVSWHFTVGSDEEKNQMSRIESEVEKKANVDPEFRKQLDPWMVIVSFGGVVAAVSPMGWGGVVAASPVPVIAMNGSDFIYSVGSRENGAMFLSYIRSLGHHGWLLTYNNARHHS
jgi:hypothetical protein